MVRTFPKRPGCVDSGRDFEKLMCLLYAVKLTTNDAIENFDMTSNSKNCGAFDDIEMKVFFNTGATRRFLFQLKHKDHPQVLGAEHFESKRDFCARKYFESIADIPAGDDVFILYTNNRVRLNTSTLLSGGIEVRPSHHFADEDLLLNTSKRSENGILEFTSPDRRRFYLFADQHDVKTVEYKLKEMLHDLVKCEIYPSIAHFMYKWWSQNYILSKHDFVVKLTELAFSPFIKCLSNDKVNEKTEILKEVVGKFDLTIVESGQDFSLESIWGIEDTRDYKNCMKKFLLNKSDEFAASKIGWYLEQTPLILNVDAKNKPMVKSVLNLLKKILGNKKIILFGHVTKEDFEEWDTFESLSDLIRKPAAENISFILENFHVSLQGRPKISLQQLLNIDEDIAQDIKTAHLFEMSQKCYRIGPQKELPNLHIPRRVYFPGSKKLVLEKDIFANLDNNLNVFCAPPGMGKSRMLQVLSNTYCPPDSWSFYVSLMDCNQFLARQPEMELLVLEEEDSLTTRVQQILLKRKKVEIFLDGLDEVDGKHLERVLKCAQFMKMEGLHVWISSRENLREKLRRSLQVELLEIQELDEEQQGNYVLWKLQEVYERSQIERIRSVVFNSVDVNNSRRLLGIPLQLYLITEIFLQDKNAYEEVDRLNMFVLTRMYELFFEGKQQFKHDKLGIDRSQKSQLGVDFLLELEEYEIPALLSCLDHKDVEKLEINVRRSQHFLRKVKTEGDKNGIIKTVNSEGEAIFEHQTFAEYFACLWLKKNREKVVLLKRTFFRRRYDNLRKIFDVMMAEKHPLHLAVIYQNQAEIEKHLDKRLDRDEGGRLAFHLACSYGNFLELSHLKLYIHLRSKRNCYKKMIDLLVDVNQRDRLFEFDALDYSLYRGSLYPIEKLFERGLLTLRDIQEKIVIHGFEVSISGVYLAMMGYYSN